MQQHINRQHTFCKKPEFPNTNKQNGNINQNQTERQHKHGYIHTYKNMNAQNNNNQNIHTINSTKTQHNIQTQHHNLIQTN